MSYFIISFVYFLLFCPAYVFSFFPTLFPCFLYIFVILMWNVIQLRKKCVKLIQGWCFLNECGSEYEYVLGGIKRIQSGTGRILSSRVRLLLVVRLCIRIFMCSVVLCTFGHHGGLFFSPRRSTKYLKNSVFWNTERKRVSGFNPTIAEEKIQACNMKMYNRSMTETLRSVDIISDSRHLSAFRL
jgi:uncharacterized protein YneF (UPF0154 family)